MSRLTRALAAATMAVAATGGGLLIAAAGAVPASAAAHGAPPGGHPGGRHSGGHVVATITMRPKSRIGPNVISPCAVKPGAAPAYDGGGGCDSGIVTCDVTAFDPYQLSPGGSTIYFDADTHCSEAVPQISMGQDVNHTTPIDPNNPLTDSTVVNNTSIAQTFNQAVCQPGAYAVNASARITPPDGDVLSGSLHDTSFTVTFFASDCPSGGGGGGGGGGGRGCLTATPAVTGQPPTRRPDMISCP